ncbi:hypothetical protein [Acetobacter fallax]|uniref:hypothetical protein n=1 Tax=Acetobacter fallax TaxID=1737473 RepID=UPI001A7EE595|nr:hypothetical protein [Acetobacter fallax]
MDTKQSDILKDWSLDRKWLSEFEARLDSIEVVTFDVFDTALTRTLDTPVDVFALIEKRLTDAHGAMFAGYAVKREDAEKTARHKAGACGRREIGFDEILDVLLSENRCFCSFRQVLADTEFEAERDVCFAVPEIKAAVRICIKRGIRVLFVSDMYLPECVIRDLLERVGYAVPDLLVSCETGCVKSDGTQWPVVRTVTGQNSRVLHIGDNEWSDGVKALEAGFEVLIFERARSDHRRGGPLTPDILPFSRLLRATMLSAAPGAGHPDCTVQPPDRTMARLGASWGAIVAGSYVRWIAARARTMGLTHIYFCARDGWLVQRAWQAAGLVSDRK